MKDFFELITDKRFSLKFRLLNILSGDYLRNFLALGVQHYVNDCNKVLNDDIHSDSYKIERLQRNIIKAQKGINDIWQI